LKKDGKTSNNKKGNFYVVLPAMEHHLLPLSQVLSMCDQAPACCERFLLAFSAAPLAPNASLQLRPKAGAQRTLEAVSCKALFK
jgi:hypothetical protein